MKRLTHSAAACITVGLLSFAPAHAQQTRISTWNFINDGDFSGLLWSWGGVVQDGQFLEMLGVGQSFTVLSDRQRIDSVSINIPGGDNCNATDFRPCDVLFRLFLVGWSPNLSTVGSLLWASGIMSLAPFTDNSTTLPRILASPRVIVNAGTYAALVLPVGLGPLVPSDFSGFIFPDVSWVGGNGDPGQLRYAGGTMVSYSGLPVAQPDGGWQPVEGADLYFDAHLTTTPEPVSVILVGTGILGLAAARRRKKGTRSK